MLRRAFLNTLAALPAVSVPERLVGSCGASGSTTETVNQEGDMWFWYYVYAALQKDRVMSTEQSRKHAVSEMNLTSLNDSDARQVLKRANNGEYTISDMPDQWREALDSIDQVRFK
jgi:hypothetical protein